MSASLPLVRIAQLLEMVERTRSAEVAAATLSVLEVQRTAAGERAAMAVFNREFQHAVIQQHAGEQSLHAALQVAAQARLAQALVMESSREEARMEALSAYHASRLQLEQVATTVRQMRATEGLRAARFEQSEADERFLARRVRTWRERQDAQPLPASAKNGSRERSEMVEQAKGFFAGG